MAERETRRMQTAMAAIECALKSERVSQALVDAGLKPLAEFRRGFTGQMVNPPTVFLIPVKTPFRNEDGNGVQSSSYLTVRLGITGADPQQVVDQAIDYMVTIDTALRATDDAGDWPDTVTWVHIRAHDYGPLMKGQGFAVFPDLDLEVEMTEVI